MKGMLKAYLIYMAGAIAVLGYVWWVSRGQTGGLNITELIRHSRNGHVDIDETAPVDVA